MQVLYVFTATLGHHFLCDSLFAGVSDLHRVRRLGFLLSRACTVLRTESRTLSTPCFNTFSVPLNLNNLTDGLQTKLMPSLVEVSEWFRVQPVPADASTVAWLQSSGEEILARDGWWRQPRSLGKP